MLDLVKNGKAVADIIIKHNAAGPERRAADELKRVLFESSGAELEIVMQPGTSGPHIYIGSSQPEKDLDLSENRLGYDGYIVKSTEHYLILTGRRSYSSLYAVYHFLERYAGCGFFEEGDQIQKRESFSVDSIEVAERPHFKWRQFFANMMDAYSGMRWWTWEQFKPWIDYLVKKRFNILEGGNIVNNCGIGALAAKRLGVSIELTDWQKERITLLRKVLDYARDGGIRVRYPMQLHIGDTAAHPGFSPYVDGVQLNDFIQKYQNKNDAEISVVKLNWCGEVRIVMDPRDPVTKAFTTASVEAYNEALGTDHLYGLWLPTEEAWNEDDPKRLDELTEASVGGMLASIKAADPEAEIFSPRVCSDNPSGEAQVDAVRAAELPVVGNMFLNHSGRMYDFLRCDYYWNLPWTTGMCGQCGGETNPNGDIEAAIKNAKLLVHNPQAANCHGFTVSSETNHRNVMTMDLYSELSWNPAEMDADEYIELWNRRRYGLSADRTRPAVQLIARTLMKSFDYGMHHGPLYRNWKGAGLPGLTSRAVKELIAMLPDLKQILSMLLSEFDALKDSPMYRFDLIDIGRTYLAAIFNDVFARARKAFRAGNATEFEAAAARTEETMHFMAHFCGAHEQFRLKTHDEWAARWPPIIPGHENSETNWITFTALISLDNWRTLLDYMPEDYAEMIEHYYFPRVSLYIQKMRELLEKGEDISGRLVGRNTEFDIPSRIADWATPQGNVKWSAYGITCEPELTAGDIDLARKIFTGGSVSGRFDFYSGSLEPLVQTLLRRFPPPDDLDDILEEPEFDSENYWMMFAGMPGDVTEGFNVPGFVEKVEFPPSFAERVTVTEIRNEYNIARGEVSVYQVNVDPFLKLVRLENEHAKSDGRDIVAYSADVNNKKYKLLYDSGTASEIASFVVKQM